MSPQFLYCAKNTITTSNKRQAKKEETKNAERQQKYCICFFFSKFIYIYDHDGTLRWTTHFLFRVHIFHIKMREIKKKNCRWISIFMACKIFLFLWLYSQEQSHIRAIHIYYTTKTANFIEIGTMRSAKKNWDNLFFDIIRIFWK